MARFELCGLYHQKWAKARSDPDTAPAAAKAVRDAVDTYLRAAKSDANDQRKLRTLLLAADVALHSQPAEATAARGYLTRAKPFADALPQTSTWLEDYHFRLFEVAKSAGDNLSIQRHANWLLDNAAGSSYERAVIISLAIASDKAVKSATGDERRKRLEAAARVYLRLVQLQGDSKEVLTSSKNARVAVSKLAAYESQLGNHAQATKRLESLLEIAPKDTEYLRRTAKSGYLAGQCQQSVERWRLLLAGLPKASEPWYEAKHYQLKCLARLDRAKAQEVYKQFKLLHPDIKVDSWRGRFEQLEKELQ